MIVVVVERRRPLPKVVRVVAGLAQVGFGGEQVVVRDVEGVR